MTNNKVLIDALQKIVDMCRQQAIDQFGDADKAELFSCYKVAAAALASYAEQAPPERSACLDKEEVLRDVKDIYAQSHHYKDWDNMWQNRGFNETDTDSSAIMAMDEWAKIKTLEGQVTCPSCIEKIKELQSIKL